MAHLTALKALQQLPELLQQQLTQLEARQAASSSQRALSHGHLNRLHRIRNQTQSLSKKISVLDQDWKQFMLDVEQKVHLHSQHYQKHRGELMDSLNQKLLELDAVKKEVSSASQALLGQTTEPDMNFEDHELQQQLLHFQQLSSTLTSSMAEAPSMPQEISDGDDMEDASPELATEEVKPARTNLAPAPFRSPGSPGKVSTHTLKQDKHKDRPKEGEKEKSKHKSATAYREDA